VAHYRVLAEALPFVLISTETTLPQELV
jgi:hypothetical protein